MKKLLLLLLLIPSLNSYGEFFKSNKTKECHVYWNGWKFEEGTVKKSEYKGWKISRYDVPILFLFIPNKMSKALNCKEVLKKGNPFTQTGECSKFLVKHYSQIEALCK